MRRTYTVVIERDGAPMSWRGSLRALQIDSRSRTLRQLLGQVRSVATYRLRQLAKRGLNPSADIPASAGERKRAALGWSLGRHATLRIRRIRVTV